VGYAGNRQATPILLDGLSRLEYRGYDSAGIAVLNGGQAQIKRTEGKLKKLADLVNAHPPEGMTGIGHTRWATHGRPSENNAHPHRYQGITIVHNGIIENYAELRESLAAKGHQFSSETDSEIFAHLVYAEKGSRRSTLEALRRALSRVRGSYALVLLDEAQPDRLFAARSGSPLVVGLGSGESFVASDVPALLPYTQDVLYLEEGDVAVVDASGVKVEDSKGRAVARKPKKITWTLAMAQKEGFKHFMLKEIFEQPRALGDTLLGRLSHHKAQVELPEVKELFKKKADLEKFDKIYVIACGTSWHAALVSKFSLEACLKAMVQVEQASEFRYRNPIVDARTLVVAISQSGETADTLFAVKAAKKQGAKILGISNVVDSSLARESHAILYTHTGPEIGVAATKTFTAQILVLLLLALYLGQIKGSLKKAQAQELVKHILEIPSCLEEMLKQAPQIRELALKHTDSDDCLFIGRGPQFPIALEGALKLKEISYLHAEGYPAGELKHGPIALIDQGSPVVAIALQDGYYEKMLSNIQEVLSREASVIALATAGDRRIAETVQDVVYLPALHPWVMPILSAVPLQLLAYYLADQRGHDVDQPRNLAKSVTVE
jgi:glucosamine--fructose-6-phosphate aminotransferase (isomerizing)